MTRKVLLAVYKCTYALPADVIVNMLAGVYLSFPKGIAYLHVCMFHSMKGIAHMPACSCVPSQKGT